MLSSPVPAPKARLHPSLDATFRGRRLLVFGGSGFLGKVWLALLLERVPCIERLTLVLRPRHGLCPSARFERDVLGSPVFQALRERAPERFDALLASRLRVVEGDLDQEDCGLSLSTLTELEQGCDAIVNVSGLVDFHPPLDQSLAVNARGVKRLAALAARLGGVPLLHTSTCYVAGCRQGQIEEAPPHLMPPPGPGPHPHLGWDTARELELCELAIAESTGAHGPSPRRRRLLVELGRERARAWGFPNTYTYTKYLGERLLADSGARFCIVRPSVIESTWRFPFPGWNEGMNTSAPIIYAILEGLLEVPGSRRPIDVIPCDLVASGMLLALKELLEGQAETVYQLGSSDTNPASSAAFFKWAASYRRKYRLRQGDRRRFRGWVDALLGVSILDQEAFLRRGPSAQAARLRQLVGLGRRVVEHWSFSGLGRGLSLLERICEKKERIGRMLGAFTPFLLEVACEFRSEHVRRAHGRLSPSERHQLPWDPERIDWHHWFMTIHAPALERWVFPDFTRRRRQKPALVTQGVNGGNCAGSEAE